MARVAVLDVGSNTVKLLIADVDGGAAHEVETLSDAARIGAGLGRGARSLSAEAMDRGAVAIAAFAAEARAQGVTATAAVGTAALRDAENGAAFVERVRRETGVEIEVLPGAEEARLSFLAVRRDPLWRREAAIVVVDIGGGSTEIVCGGDGDLRRRSIGLGAVKLTERALCSDPPTAQEIGEARSEAAAAFAREETAVGPVIGVGGTFTNLAGMEMGGPYGTNRTHGATVTGHQVAARIALLAAAPAALRALTPGLDPRRADIIVGGAIVAEAVMARLGAESIAVSERGLRWGVLYERFMDAPGSRA